MGAACGAALTRDCAETVSCAHRHTATPCTLSCTFCAVPAVADIGERRAAACVCVWLCLRCVRATSACSGLALASGLYWHSGSGHEWQCQCSEARPVCVVGLDAGTVAPYMRLQRSTRSYASMPGSVNAARS